MKFFNAINREFLHVDTNILTIPFEIDSASYLQTGGVENYQRIKKEVEDKIPDVSKYNDGEKIHLEVTLNESSDFILSDDELAEIFSNMLASFAGLFEISKNPVSLPKEPLLKKFACSPMMVVQAVTTRVVKNPFQISIKRVYTNENGEIAGEERVTIV